jgi:hypothetical protein
VIIEPLPFYVANTVPKTKQTVHVVILAVLLRLQPEQPAAQKVYWLTIICRGETGGESPRKMRAMFSAF